MRAWGSRRKEDTARLAAIEERLGDVSTQLSGLNEAIGALASQVTELGGTLDGRVPDWDQAKWDQVARRILRGKSSMEASLRGLVTRDMSALLSLHDLVTLKGEPLQATGFAASPETLLALVGLVSELPDGAVIVEAGSGLSSMWSALAAHQLERNVSIVSLEHEANYAEATRTVLDRQGVGSLVDVRYAPLEPVRIEGSDEIERQWYARSSYDDLARIDLLFVDGPPMSTGPDARYPAVPQLLPVLADGAVVILDDTDRAEERKCVERWRLLVEAAGGSLQVERELDRATQLRFRKVAPLAQA